MKKILLTMVAILSLTAVQAQESDNKQQAQFRGPRQITPEQMADRMANDLKLTDEQKTKVLALNKEYEKVIAGPQMRGPRPQRPDGESGATAQNGQQRPERPQMTEEQREQMQKEMQQRSHAHSVVDSAVLVVPDVAVALVVRVVLIHSSET